LVKLFIKLMLALWGFALFAGSFIAIIFLLSTDFIPEHSLIYIFDIPEIMAEFLLIMIIIIFLLLPALILLAALQIINLLEKINHRTN